MSLEVGSFAPDFTLPSTAGRDFCLSRDAKDKSCIIYIYPQDFTPICTEQACAFKDAFETFRDLDIDVYGLSRDPIEEHLRFKESYNLPFELISDVEGKVLRSYGIIVPLSKYTKMFNFTKRVTYLLNKDHKIISVYQNAFFPKKHIEALIEKLK